MTARHGHDLDEARGWACCRRCGEMIHAVKADDEWEQKHAVCVVPPEGLIRQFVEGMEMMTIPLTKDADMRSTSQRISHRAPLRSLLIGVPIMDGRMQKMNVNWWCEAAVEIEALSWSLTVFGNLEKGQVKSIAKPIVERLQAMYNAQSMVRLSSSALRGTTLHRLLSGLVSGEDTTGKITQEEEKAIRDALIAFKQAIGDELSMLDAWYVQPKGAYSTSALIDHGDRAAGPGYELLSGPARADMRAAGRCLAFELPTAVGFHSARA